MITYTTGNLLDADVEALVNTVNTVGVMGKGIALMFKERFPANTAAYVQACKAGEVQTGRVFVTETGELMGPRWIVNFPTKRHWRSKSRMEWIIEGLADLRRFVEQHHVRSIAIPPLGAGNGGLDWASVKPHIEQALGDLEGVRVVVYEPTTQYQNVAKAKGVEKLTPARALIAELVRRYWVLGMECSLLEIQKLAWFLERAIEAEGLEPLDLRFVANNYGPYADRLRHLLDSLDGGYLKCDKRISDCEPLDTIWFNDSKRDKVELYLKTEANAYLPALEKATKLIDGFESPYGLELLSTVDWLLAQEQVAPEPQALLEGVRHWPAGERWARRKLELFDMGKLELALDRLRQVPLQAAS
ncbi:O-acetyl-ADP-ribose deacetylase (regulator of RNase III), contains Macro domain [Thiohalospira halophila DSM 15071]|uniref:O-acetyl-ADP-ribose deacetylase (Regulator of RNase III), contains Macro domain n=1 Tax=Thiohalospira halophila DSM 15071 TaxID=1123397 RepID=A0A1I1W9W0_9GAMM|nr:macro domain-containing protein [Thiohalospira halophila]SFD91178.1 O-acetyl-ADP-ribose deacetylase (regulator of RNase III), contains Macro domain [Thiohalospira halophila DSM 15071]